MTQYKPHYSSFLLVQLNGIILTPAKKIQFKTFTETVYQVFKLYILKPCKWFGLICQGMGLYCYWKTGIERIYPFLAIVPFWSPWKYQETKGFLVFSGGSKGNITKKRANSVVSNNKTLEAFCDPKWHQAWKTLVIAQANRVVLWGGCPGSGLSPLFRILWKHL